MLLQTKATPILIWGPEGTLLQISSHLISFSPFWGEVGRRMAFLTTCAILSILIDEIYIGVTNIYPPLPAVSGNEEGSTSPGVSPEFSSQLFQSVWARPLEALLSGVLACKMQGWTKPMFSRGDKRQIWEVHEHLCVCMRVHHCVCACVTHTFLVIFHVWQHFSLMIMIVSF